MDYKALYNTADKEVLKLSEDIKDRSKDRVEEIMTYAKAAGFKRIGIANCISFQKIANQLEEILTDAGFTVSTTNCKLGNVPLNDLVPGHSGTACNPAGQAAYLAQQKTELNIVIGLCVGHDIIFNQKSEAPVTTLIVKDRKLKHKTINRFVPS